MTSSESHFDVRWDAEGVTVARPDKTEHIDWDAIDEVAIVTTDEGPIGIDMWLILVGSDYRCEIPGGIDAFNQVLFVELKARCPGIDWRAVINAMASADHARFVVWSKGASVPAHAKPDVPRPR